MKTLRRMGALLGSALLLLTLTAPAAAEAPGSGLTILFTHDTHDHFYPDANNVGGYTRLATALKEQRKTPTPVGNGQSVQYPTVTVDGGDFSMGSLFQTVYSTQAPELRALGLMGYDVTTLGNHEFDYRPQGLADMLTTAGKVRQAGQTAMTASYTGYREEFEAEYGPLGQAQLPAIVQANYKTPKDPSAPGMEALKKALENYPVTDYTVLDREGLKIAVFGVMGVDSDECAPMSGMAQESMVDAAKRVVAEIRSKEQPDFIICLSHGGTEKEKGEDFELAKAVDGIDVIISGHTHTTLDAPIEVNNTLIVSCGPYTQNLGRLTVTKDAGGVSALEYKLIPIDAAIPADPEMTALAEKLKVLVDREYLSRYGMAYDEVLAHTQADTPPFTIAETGDYIGKAYLETVKELEGENYDPIAFAVTPDGVIRGRLPVGEVTTATAYDILSLGSGADGSPGYPLMSIYLTGKDLKNAFEVDASVSQLMPSAELFGAGCYWQYNRSRMFLDRVIDCGLRKDEKAVREADGSWSGSYGVEKIQDDKLYRVVADLYSGQMLATVKSKSFGLLSITARDENGNEVTDFETRILHDKEGREIKAWYALAHQLKKEGEVHQGAIFRSKFRVVSQSPLDLVWPMGAPTAVVLGAIALVVLVVVLIVRRVRRGKRTDGFAPPYRGR